MQSFFVNRSLFNGNKISFRLEQGYRFSDKFSIFYNLELEPQKEILALQALWATMLFWKKRCEQC
jgi:hypothetical protein